jgi:hypothetical protein
VLELLGRLDTAVPPGDRAEDLGREEHEVVALTVPGAHIGDEERGGRGDRGTVGIVGRFVDDVTEQLDGELRIDRAGHGQPDALAERTDRLRLIGLKQDIAGVGGKLEEIVRDEVVEGRTADGPGLLAALQADQRARDLEPGVGDACAGAWIWIRFFRRS